MHFFLILCFFWIINVPSIQSSPHALYLGLFEASLKNNPKLLDQISWKAFEHIGKNMRDFSQLKIIDNHPFLHDLKKKSLIKRNYLIFDMTPYVKQDIPFITNKDYFFVVAESDYPKWIKLMKTHQKKKKIIWEEWKLISLKEYPIAKTFYKIIMILEPGKKMAIKHPVILIACDRES